MKWILILLSHLVPLGPGLALAVGAVVPLEGFPYRDATFEELAALKVSSVSKTDESYFRAAAAVSVITDDDIRRSGALTLPEVLRMAPGVEVGQYGSRGYAVTMRGFNGLSANKLLPLVDGRSLYSARYGGTIWEIRDLPLEDVQQIEVVGGPGGTTWGTNAVNGVVNIITKDARQTQGTHVAGGGGIYEEAFLYAREGVAVGSNQWLRVYAKAFGRGALEPVAAGPDPDDSWSQYRAGFRFDREPSLAAKSTVTGDVFFSDANQWIQGVSTVAQSSGGHLLGRHERTLAGDAKVSLQAYYDRFSRNSGGNISDADVGELELRHEFGASERHRFTWGGSYRFSRLQDKVTAFGYTSTFSPDVRFLNTGALFLQDVVALTPEALTLTLGTKVEYNDFTGVEALPSARLAWTPASWATGWVAYSRAVRIPSRIENDQTQTFPTFRSLANDGLGAETVDAFEAGGRLRLANSLTVAASVYWNEYRNLVSSEPIAPSNDFTYMNFGEARGVGGELSTTYQATEWWRVVLTWSVLDFNVKAAPPSQDASLAAVAAQSPEHQVGLRSLWNIGRTWEADAWFRWVDELPRRIQVPAYTALDLRIGKQLGRGWELALVARNLLEPSHSEFIFNTLQAEVPRSFYLRFDWHR